MAHGAVGSELSSFAGVERSGVPLL